jgi:hypothetical protein
MCSAIKAMLLNDWHPTAAACCKNVQVIAAILTGRFPSVEQVGRRWILLL